MRQRAAAFLTTVVLSWSAPMLAADPAPSRGLTFEDRIAAQRAIEEVYWRHRIWPKENPGTKPLLQSFLSDDALRAKVEDYLKKSSALETWWKRPVTGEQLQAELDRMTAGSRDPGMLRELFAALHDDPLLIAETLARQTLVDRLIRNWYATDDRFHGELKREAERELRDGRAQIDELRSMRGQYAETTYRLTTPEGSAAREPASGAFELDPEAWREWREDLALRFGSTSDAIPIRTLSELRHQRDRFVVTAVLSLAEGEATVATVAWPKRTFDEWWSVERNATPMAAAAGTGSFSIAGSAEACEDDTWRLRMYDPGVRVGHTAVWTGTEMIIWGGSATLNGLRFDPDAGGRYNPATDAWTPTSLSPVHVAGTTGHTAIWTGTEMIVWGGGSEGSTTGARYAPSTDSWTTIDSGFGTARTGHTAVWTGAKMIVWGGSYRVSGVDQYPNWGYVYTPSTNLWSPTASGANTPAGRIVHSAIWTGAEMIIWGGRSGGGLSAVNSGGRYDPVSGTWSPTSTGSGAPAARYLHTTVWTGQEMIVWGGHGAAVNTYLNTGARYDPATDGWTTLSVAGSVPIGRELHTAVWTGSEMIVWGGSYRDSSRHYLDTGGRYDPALDEWTPLSMGPNAPERRHQHTAVWTGSEMIVWGGFYVDGATHYLYSGGRYDPATDSWTMVSTRDSVGAPISPRHGHTALWTGAEMIVWGGTDPSGQFGAEGLSSGGRYDPAIDGWTPTSTGLNVPGARGYHSAIWTGTEMIVWGGRHYAGGTQYPQPGGRYNPTLDSWVSTSVGANAPEGRTYPSAVWTGSEMIVWGGFSSIGGNRYLATGGRYDPATDGWTTLAGGPNVPTGRAQHTAVWTGSEMIVWGGSYRDPILRYPESGGRYVPGLDVWIATPVGGNAPVPRAQHTALWTGGEMIVWGGEHNDRVSLGTGGRYKPGTNTWSATSTVGDVPPASYDHDAAWTGSEMLVWGHLGSNVGGRYDPSSNTWKKISNGANAPEAQAYHTAAWSGSEMMVWGGDPQGAIWLYCASNLSQTLDGDGDGIVDAADNCPAASNAGQGDDEGDDIGDACDNCPGVANANQTDGDVEITTDARQWAVTAAASSQYGSSGYAASQATGAPNTVPCTDAPTAWAPLNGSSTLEWLELFYPAPVHSTGIVIHETYPGGFVDRVDLRDQDGIFHTVWTGPDTSTCDVPLALTWPATSFVTNEVWIHTQAPEFEQVDAVELLGLTVAPRPDGIGDACDNCPGAPNPAQSDFDEDGQGDFCDGDDGVIYQYWSDRIALKWDPESGETGWNQYVGDLDVLHAIGEYTQALGSNPLANQACDLTAPTVNWPGNPAVAKVAFYLVTGVQGGVEGSLGDDSDGIERPNVNPCP